MGERDKKQPGIQPPEDYYGHEKNPRRGAREEEPERTGTRAPPPKEDPEHEQHAHAIDPAERTPGAILDDIPDGDGPRSDAGTNPLPESYWAGYPGNHEPDKH
ncbi:hypothetical protein [Pyxidicoccus trucidator]|uniref:hypothetical protein n=1 Tax=Pyxidicoccus trucidator TaxID=2709662 RepID=UPI0013DBBDA2|nr:hypothetical protein [Pyxidicoccus trucidator]